MRCPVGKQPNEKKEECDFCAADHFNPAAGELCRKCPANTYPNEEKSACLLYDQIVDSNGTLW